MGGIDDQVSAGQKAAPGSAEGQAVHPGFQTLKHLLDNIASIRYHLTAQAVLRFTDERG
jgi:hypothetical protein